MLATADQHVLLTVFLTMAEENTFLWADIGMKTRVNLFFVFPSPTCQIDAQYNQGCDRKGPKDIFHFIWHISLHTTDNTVCNL